MGSVAGNLWKQLAGAMSLVNDRNYLVTQPLGGDDGDLIAYPLVGLEVEGELGCAS